MEIALETALTVLRTVLFWYVGATLGLAVLLFAVYLGTSLWSRRSAVDPRPAPASVDLPPACGAAPVRARPEERTDAGARGCRPPDRVIQTSHRLGRLSA